jgi:hypothetical protein
MSARDPQTEATPLGEQMLVPGVAPVSTRQRIEARMNGLLMPKKPQKPLDIGLFDDMERNQLNLF